MKTSNHALGLLVHAKTREEWHRWLEANHAKASAAWLVIHAKASGKPSVPYDDAVEEALCFGWIDSTIMPVEPGVRAQRYTPRRPRSAASELNKARVRKLVRQGRMTPAGLAALPGVDEWLDPGPLVVPPDILRRIKANRDAWKHFKTFSENYKRIRIGWIDSARSRPEVFEQRLAHFVAKTAAGKTYGTIPE